jgi:protein-L-isoaspartate(D-aspartate) O-methyltransferase
MVAVMTQTLRLQRHHRVLEIGTGSGYQCAVLARLAAEVWTIERIGALAERAQKALAELGITNVHYRVADGSLGWPEDAPFDRILITAGAPEVPKPLLEQLVTGGLMVLPVGPTDQQMLVEVERREGRWTERSVLACRFVRLIGQAGWPNDKADFDSPGGWY